MKEKKNKRGETLKVVNPTGAKDLDFFEQVFSIVRQIPKGRVSSYGAIAKCIGTGKAARLVGYAMNASHHAKPKVPAHRVVNHAGLLTGKHHFATATQMQELLEKEGIAVEKDKVLNFKNLFWNPLDELY